MPFNVKDFVRCPSVEVLESLKKTELLAVAKDLLIEDVKMSMTKSQLKRIIAEFFVDEELFDETVLDVYEEKASESLELKKFQIQQDKDLKESEMKMKLEQEKELEIEKMKFELEKLKLTADLSTSTADVSQPIRFVPSREIRMVPPFNETEVDKYFQHFEKVATNCGWPRDCWAIMLQSVLKGKAQHAYSALSADDCADYDLVKTAVLRAYELVPEAYRQKFRNLRKPDYQTHVEFAHEKEVFFERWCTSKEVNDGFENLKQLVLIEEFKRCVRDDVKTYLDEKSVSNLTEAAVMADDYALTHKKKFTGQPNTAGTFQKKYTGNKTSFESDSGAKSNALPKSTNEPKSKYDNNNAQKNKPTAPRCSYCKRLGHLIGDCWSLKNKNKTESTLPNALVSSEQGVVNDSPQHVSETCNCTIPVTKDIDSVRK